MAYYPDRPRCMDADDFDCVECAFYATSVCMWTNPSALEGAARLSAPATALATSRRLDRDLTTQLVGRRAKHAPPSALFHQYLAAARAIPLLTPAEERRRGLDVTLGETLDLVAPVQRTHSAAATIAQVLLPLSNHRTVTALLASEAGIRGPHSIGGIVVDASVRRVASEPWGDGLLTRAEKLLEVDEATAKAALRQVADAILLLPPDAADAIDSIRAAYVRGVRGLALIPVLPPSEELALARRFDDIRRTAVGSRTAMIEANLRLVVMMARRYQGPGMNLDDLVSEGNVGLMRAVEKFDFRLGFKFSTYATWWIRQAITRALQDQS
ncbi:MAG: sigma-70 family RNA polymerase sigma factor, partial [Dehalococcoidia bacterium]